MKQHKVNLATTETISSNYAGEVADFIISAALLSAGSIENGAVTALPGIKYKHNIPKLDLSGLVGNGTCDFTPLGTVTRSERVLTTEEFEVNLKLCTKSYRPTFDAQRGMGASSHDQLAPDFQSYLVDLVAANVAASRETVLWSGANATAGEFDGIEVLMTNQATQPTGYEVSGTTVTAANVIAEIQKVLDAASTALYQKEGFQILIPSGIERHYIAAQAALGYRDLYHDGKTALNFQGVPLISCPGMTDDVMFGTYRDNFFYGIGELSDWTRVEVIDQRPVDGSNNVHVIMQWADGVQIGNPEDVVTYGITNTGN